MKGLNIKELCRLIRADKKRIIWSRSDGYHYITNRRWLVRFKDGELPQEVLVLLFSIFAEIPEPGRSLVSSLSHLPLRNKDALDVRQIYQGFDTAVEGEVTPFIKDATMQLRIVKWQDDILYLDENYLSMVDIGSAGPPKCVGKLSPVFFLDGDVVVLPVRTMDDEQDKELLEAIRT